MGGSYYYLSGKLLLVTSAECHAEYLYIVSQVAPLSLPVPSGLLQCKSKRLGNAHST